MKSKYYVILFAMVALLCSLLVVSPLIGAAAADNLAANGDLELGNTNSWEAVEASIESTVVHSGKYALKLNATDVYVGAVFKAVPVRKNATITVSFYYRYASYPGGRLYHVYTYKGANPYSGAYSNADCSFSKTSTTAWTQISYTFNSGDFDSIYLKFCPGGSGGTPCYIDNLMVTSEGGDETVMDPYLTSFGTKNNRPLKSEYNLIRNGGFESTDNAQWNTTNFLKNTVSVIDDATAPEGKKSLYFDSGSTTAAVRYAFPVTVEKYTQYTFSAWVKSPRLSAQNRATATFGVANAATGQFLVYEPYNGNGNGTAILSTPNMQLMATAPDGEWHLRSVTFYSGSANTVNIALYGAGSRLYLDDIALFKMANGVEYISDRRRVTLTASVNADKPYCADEMSLIPVPHMTGKAAENYWSANPAWRNGFLSFEDTADSHETALKYTASAHTEWKLHYVDWVDVKPGVSYTFTVDVKRLTAGGGRLALLDDNVVSPAEFYTIDFSAVDSDWQTYSVTFNTEVYSRIGMAIVDGGGSAYIDKLRLFESAYAVSGEPEETLIPTTYPMGGKTAVMETGKYDAANVVENGDFETGTTTSWSVFQSTKVSSSAKRIGSYGVHLKGNGGQGALLEQRDMPSVPGEKYELVFWYKCVSGSFNWALIGEQTNTTYVNGRPSSTAWQFVRVPFTCGSDKSLSLNFYGVGNGVSESVYLDDIVLQNISGGPPLGVAFRMELNTLGAAIKENSVGYLKNATVDVYGDGTGYPLKRMGCVVTNDQEVGTNQSLFNLDNLTTEDRTVVDVPAVYLLGVTATSASFAVRVVSIPYRYSNAPIYARPYYIFSRDGEDVVVYGNIYSRSYADANGSEPFTVE